MDDYTNGKGVPLGFGMALAQNARAVEMFSQLSKSEKRDILEGARSVQSKQEMREYVDSIANRSR